MSSKHGVLCQKVVTLSQVDLGKIELPDISPEVREIIREAKVESLLGLLGPESRRIVRQLVEEYWKA